MAAEESSGTGEVSIDEIFGKPDVSNGVQLLDDTYPWLEETVDEVNDAWGTLDSRFDVTSYRFGTGDAGIEEMAPDRPGRLHWEFVDSYPVDVAIRLLDDPGDLEGEMTVENGCYSCTVSYDPGERSFTVGQVSGPKYTTGGDGPEEMLAGVSQALRDEGFNVSIDGC